jgi:hypothetical protein
MALAYIEKALGVRFNGGVELGFRHSVRPLQRLYFQRQVRADGMCLYRATFPTLSYLLNFHLFFYQERCFTRLNQAPLKLKLTSPRQY